MTLSAARLALIERGPLLSVEIKHHPLSRVELIEQLGLRREAPSLSIVDQQIAEDLHLAPIGANVHISTPAGMLRECPTYRVEMHLKVGNGVAVLPTTVVGIRASSLLPNRYFQGILGRSSLQNARFVYDGAAGRFGIEVVTP